VKENLRRKAEKNSKSERDIFFMELALAEADRAREDDEVPVGAVVTLNDAVIASDHNRVRAMNNPTAHGEMLVLAAAAAVVGDWRLNDCTLYTTKEPCPMCAGACVMSRISRVVFALRDPAMGCLGGGLRDFSRHAGFNHSFSVTAGVLEAQSLKMLREFFTAKR
jgi:tRNA(adenine34) deaminase